MKLSKAKLIKMVKPKLEILGFTEFKDTKDGWQGLFCKELSDNFYLSLGFTIHRYYDCAFTASYYMSKTTVIGATWGDIPNESYKRPGFFLTDKERSIYPEDSINVKGTLDIWWYGSDEKSVLDFLIVIELTEPRFVNQPELIQQIEKSHEVQTLSENADKVKELVSKNELNGSYRFLPSKEIDGIPMIWFKASEEVLANSKNILNPHTVVRLAADAYRQKQLSSVC